MKKYKEVESDIIKLKFFTFSLRGRAKEWLFVEELSQEQWVSRREGLGKGLNTQSSNSQLATTTVLAGVEGGGTAERRHSVLPRFRAL